MVYDAIDHMIIMHGKDDPIFLCTLLSAYLTCCRQPIL